jgi:flagellar motor switch protein FliG
MIERVIAAFPTSAHKGIRHQLNHLGPIQLNDVEESRRILVRQAIRLAAEGKIFLRSGGHSQKSRYTHEPHVEYAA